jgi:L-fucose mutarotase
MLRTRLLHPEILHALASAGHGSTVLLADGNFPHRTAPSPGAPRVYLNLAPGVVTVTQVLAAVRSAIEVERAAVMLPDDGTRLPVHEEFARLLDGTPLDTMGRFEFYDATRTSDLALVVATADQRVYANLLLTVGVVAPG